jgi:lipopolysaccharide/colanic/teichoic acid biosynthesis glycosyltransferase
VRVTDDVGQFESDCLCAILPHTPRDGAETFASRIRRAAQRRGLVIATSILTYPSERLPESDSNGNGNGDRRRHRDDNGNGSGNGDGNGHAHVPSRGAEELVPAFAAGFANEMARDDHADRHDDDDVCIESLLARPMPAWKRAMDVSGAAFGLILFSPVLLAVTVAVKLISPGPVLFTQRRAGLGGRPFKIYKFRTMVVNAASRQAELRAFNEQDGPAFKIEHDPRVTPLGRFLRTTSLDELPQLWNVLKGDMSLVGPRPLPCDESAGCEQWQRRRLDVTPGITCIWQVRGRSSVSFPEWCRMDMTYIRGRRLVSDVKILLLTIPAVLLRRGAR